MIKLTKLVEELSVENVEQVQPEADPTAPPKLTREQKKRLHELVGNYNQYAESVRHHGSLIDVSKKLREIANIASRYVVEECGDMVEANTATRKMTELKKYVDQFTKLAEDLEPKCKQAEAYYEDAGKILETFFEIQDVVPTSPSVGKVEAPLTDPKTTLK